jgi:hypothetical protein
VSQNYLRVLDRRMRGVKDALSDGFGVDPSRVLQNAYEPIQFDETGNVCGAQPTLGLDVHPKLKFSRERTQEAASPIARRASPPAMERVSGSSPTMSRNSPSAGCARAIRRRRWSIRST